MTESLSQEQQVESFEVGFNPTYERLRDELPGVPSSVRESWQRSDRDVANLRESYTSLEQDADLNDEARARKAQELYERQRGRIEERYQQTRKELRDASATSIRMSIPKVAGQTLEPSSKEDISNMQGERDRIVRTVERNSSKGGPFRPDVASVLKKEYEKGMQLGGAYGAARCWGTRAAAEELGVGEAWIDSLRDNKQRQYLDEARRLEQAAFAVPSTAPKPPKSLQKAVDRSQRGRMVQRNQQVFLARGSSAGETLQASEAGHRASPPRPASKKRKKSWK
jgi:hypothetical protein